MVEAQASPRPFDLDLNRSARRSLSILNGSICRVTGYYSNPLCSSTPRRAITITSGRSRTLRRLTGSVLTNSKDKSPPHYDGRLHLTSHRLIFLSSTIPPHSASAALDLALVKQTEYWTGFLKSNPKITLLLAPPPTPRLDRDQYTRNGTPPPPPLPAPPPSIPQPTEPTPPPPTSSSTDRRLACPVCTFLNHHSMLSCEVCDSPLSPPLPPTNTTPPTATPSRSSTPNPIAEPGGGASFVRLSFRKGGERAFYTALKEALGRKEWEWDGGEGGGKKARSGNVGEGAGAGGGGGIDAIMRNISLDTQERDEELDDALKDLNALMGKAKEMILLAQSMNSRLSSTTPTPSDPTTTTTAAPQAAASTLSTLGLVSAPITADQLDSEEKYHHELAKELSQVLGGKGGLMDRRGVVGLDEVWCLWNRARGVSLIPPSALTLSAPHLPLYTTTNNGPSIHPHTFPSGLTILHTPFYSSHSFQQRLLAFLDLRQALASSLSLSAGAEGGRGGGGGGGATTLEIVRNEEEEEAALVVGGGGGGMSLAMIKEMLDEVEGRGILVRDEQGGEGVRWWRNGISGSSWDGQVF
uniref:Vacuolar protein-sorting-associated protein 36 n=1 Tax=Leucosporidium scottii TaxID=5278 RepID=A0A0H5G9X3_9BASI|nr:hypothetical protein ls5930a1_00148 [Leucosporidium scottii]